MKYKNIKKIILMTLFMLAAFECTDVNGASFTASYTRGDSVRIEGSNLFSTHNMKVNIGGVLYDAYCAWYENDSPLTANYTFESVNLPQNHAQGVAYILNDDTVTYGLTAEYKRVLKTMALNLYLSVVGEYAGKEPIYDSNRFNSVDCSGSSILCANKNSPTEIANKLSTGNAWEQKVYTLYANAKYISDTYQAPYLSFTNDDTEYELVDGYYQKTYYLQSNRTLTGLSATVTGVPSSGVVVIPNLSANNITVKIATSSLQGSAENIGITVYASTTDTVANIYTAVNQDRYRFQDIVIVDYGIDPITVSAHDTLSLVRCYRSVINCENTICEKTNDNNDRVCNSDIQEYWALSCDSNDSANNQYGIRTIELASGCSLYCKETARASYPGNVNPAITLGTNLEWPTNNKGLYPLQTNATMTCRVIAENGVNEQACLQLAQGRNYTYTGNDAVANVIYNDTKVNQTIHLESSCETNSSVSGSVVTINNSCSYTLPRRENIAINKETIKFVNEFSNTATEAVTNYILITKFNGVLPIGGYNWYDDNVFTDIVFGDSYDLEIANLPLGYGGLFTTKLNTTPYVCKYQVTKDISGSCSCPPGSKYSGVDLYGQMKNEAKTCAEAKEIYCNRDNLTCRKMTGEEVDITECLQQGTDLSTCEKNAGCYNDINENFTCTKPNGEEVNITICVQSGMDIVTCEQNAGCDDNTSKVCPPETNYAGYNYENDRNYKACIYGGGTESACISMICNCGSACKYTCPADSDLAGMDISACVFEQRGMGKNLVEAKEQCEKKCYSDGGFGGTIIYRTISLENPFPSTDGDRRVTQTGLSVGMFNDSIKGRYPGTNWNSVTLVYNKILNNRGYDGSDIYQEATPLYTINLDAVAIKQIREYNRQQTENDKGGYADFELTCTDGAYCISRFLHNGMFTTASGESIIDAQNSTCANARDKASFISCYTHG